MRVYFVYEDDVLLARGAMEGPGDMIIGDFESVIEPGEELWGIPYDELVDRKAGVIEVDVKGKGRFVDEEEEDIDG